MTRSKQLTEGFRGRVFGILFLVGLISAFVQWGIAFAVEAVLPSVEVVRGQLGQQLPVFNFRNHAIQIVVIQLVNILFQTFLSICLTLLYFDLRIRKEGFDLELAARQQLQGNVYLEE